MNSENQENTENLASAYSRKVTEAVVESIQGPHSAEDDAGTVVSHKLSDQIAAAEYFRKRELAESANPLGGLFMFKVKNGSTVE